MDNQIRERQFGTSEDLDSLARISAYIKVANIYVVPVIPQRLNFAVLVQRAVQEIEYASHSRSAFDRQDLIAVALPQSLLSNLVSAIQDFPQLSLLMASVEKDLFREVFPVTPCDGIVEAVRIAHERNIGLRLIDQELAPGNLIGRACLVNPNWPDDGWVLRIGTARYLELIRPYISQPPTRFEPLESWREIHMAEALRRLQPRFRKILFVCNATNAEPIIRLLRTASPGFECLDRPPGVSYTKTRLSLDWMLRYLDDLPKLVELYEQYRAAGKAKDFDKTTALIEIIQETENRSPDLRFSPRQYRAFMQFLNNLLMYARRVSPKPDAIYEASGGCFSSAFAERLNHQLAGYAGIIDTERVGMVIPSGKDIYALRSKLLRSADGFVSRTCNPSEPCWQAARVEDPNRELTAAMDSNAEGFSRSTWPPWDEYLNKMADKIYELTRQITKRNRTRPFRGSIQLGIDSRKTLMSLWSRTARHSGLISGMPPLFVREPTHNRTISDFAHEPVVWILDVAENSPRCRFAYQQIGGLQERKVCSADYSLPFQELYPDTEGCERTTSWQTVEYGRVLGRICFSKFVTLDQVKTTFAHEFEDRMPEGESFRKTDRGLVYETLSEEIITGKPWWEVLILTGLIFAKSSVLCVAPQPFQLSPFIASSARAARKSVILIPLSRFSEKEQQIMSSIYWVRIPPNALQAADDVNGDRFRRTLVEVYGSIMKRFWRG